MYQFLWPRVCFCFEAGESRDNVDSAAVDDTDSPGHEATRAKEEESLLSQAQVFDISKQFDTTFTSNRLAVETMIVPLLTVHECISDTR